MKALYKDMGSKIGRYKAVSLDARDSIISGLRGWIFIAGEGRIGVVRLTGRKFKTEVLKYYDIKHLNRCVSAIGILPVAQATHFANNPDDRHI